VKFLQVHETTGNREYGGLANLARQLYQFVYCIFCGINLGHDTQSDIIFACRCGKELVLMAGEKISRDSKVVQLLFLYHSIVASTWKAVLKELHVSDIVLPKVLITSDIQNLPK
jgi:hypothetical protein